MSCYRYDIRTLDGVANLIPLIGNSVNQRVHPEFSTLLSKLIALCQKPILTDFSSESSQEQTLLKLLRALRDLLFSRSECVRVASMETLSWFAASNDIYLAWLGKEGNLSERDLSLRDNIRKFIPRSDILKDVVNVFQKEIDSFTLPASAVDDEKECDNKNEESFERECPTERIDILADSIGSTAGLNTPVVRNTSLMEGVNFPYYMDVISRFLEWVSENPLSSETLIRNGICGAVMSFLDYLASTEVECDFFVHICGLLWNLCEHSLQRLSSNEVALSLNSLLRKHRYHNACYLLSNTPVLTIVNQVLEGAICNTRKAMDKALRNEIIIIITLLCKAPSSRPVEGLGSSKSPRSYGNDQVLAELVESFPVENDSNDEFRNGGSMCRLSGILDTSLTYSCACELGIETKASYRWYGTSDENDLEFKQLLWDLVLCCINSEVEAFRLTADAEEELSRYKAIEKQEGQHRSEQNQQTPKIDKFTWPVLQAVKDSPFISTLLMYLDPVQETHPYLATWSPAQRRTLELQALSILTQLSPLCLSEFGDAGGPEILTLYFRKYCSFLNVNQSKGASPGFNNSFFNYLRDYGLLDLYQSHCSSDTDDDDTRRVEDNAYTNGEHDNDRLYLALKHIASVCGFNVGITGMGAAMPWEANDSKRKIHLIRTQSEAQPNKIMSNFALTPKDQDNRHCGRGSLGPEWAEVDFAEQFSNLGCPEDILYVVAMMSCDAESAISNQGQSSTLELSSSQSIQKEGPTDMGATQSSFLGGGAQQQELGIVASMGGASTPIGHVAEMAFLTLAGMCQARSFPVPELKGVSAYSDGPMVGKEAAAAAEHSKKLEAEAQERARDIRYRLIRRGAIEILLVWLRFYVKQLMNKHYHEVSGEVQAPAPPGRVNKSESSLRAHMTGARIKAAERPPAGKTKMRKVMNSSAASTGEAGENAGFARVGAAVISALWALCTQLEGAEIFLRGDGVSLLLDILEVCPHEEKGQLLGLLCDMTSVSRRSDKCQWKGLQSEETVSSLVTGEKISRGSVASSIRQFVQGWRSGVSGNNSLYILCNLWNEEEDRLGIKRGEFGEILQYVRPLDGKDEDAVESAPLENKSPSFASLSTLVPPLEHRIRPHLFSEGRQSMQQSDSSIDKRGSSAFDRLKDALRAAKMWQQLDGEKKPESGTSRSVRPVDDTVSKLTDLRPKIFCLFDSFGFEEIRQGEMGPFEKVSRYPRLHNALVVAEYFQELLIAAMWDDVRRSLEGQPVEGWDGRDQAAAVVGITSDRQPVTPIGADAAILASNLEDGALAAWSVMKNQTDVVERIKQVRMQDEQEQMQKILWKRNSDEQNAKLGHKMAIRQEQKR